MKENIIKEIANYNIEEDIEKAFPNVWRDLTDGKNIISQSSPISILLGGQPGAGKSLATMQIKERLNNNVLVINGDEFRSYLIINIMMTSINYTEKTLLNTLGNLQVKWLLKLEIEPYKSVLTL